MAKKSKAKDGAKPKAIKIKIIPRDDKKLAVEYRLLAELVAAHHEHLAEARIALAWRLDVKPSVDNRLHLGKARLQNDLQRQLHGFDFVIELNQAAWEAADFPIESKRALLDHELCHCQVSRDPKTGEVRRDENNRPVFRIRKHDIEEFIEIVQRHGCWKGDLEEFAKAAVDKKGQPLLHLHKAAE